MTTKTTNRSYLANKIFINNKENDELLIMHTQDPYKQQRKQGFIDSEYTQPS